MARLVFGSSNASSEITAILPLCSGVGERRTQRAALHLLVDAHRVVVRLRPVRDAAADPLGRADRSLAGAAGALLAPRLLAAAARPRRGSSWSACRRAGRRARPRPPGASAARSPAPRRARPGARGCPTSCRRRRGRRSSPSGSPSSRGAFTAERTMTSPPLGPGTAPRTRSRLRSGSAWTTSRFSTVTRCCRAGPPCACP